MRRKSKANAKKTHEEKEPGHSEADKTYSSRKATCHALDFWRTKTVEELAAEQGVKPVDNPKELLGDFDKIRRIVRLEGYIHSGQGFRQHPKVLDGASDLINSIFGDHGQHTRTALGINEMPLDAPVQLVLWAEAE